MKRDMSQLIQEVEGLIQSAQLRSARRKLQTVQKVATPRSQRLKLAQVSRRAGLISFALRLLNPVVRPSAKSPVVATPEESAEYAGLLVRSGANTEAIRILETLNPAEAPAAWLYRAYACITQWDYESAIPFLRNYLETPALPSVQEIVAKLNLAAALVHDRRSTEASPLLLELLERTASERLPQFHGNALELCAQNAIFQRQWREAEAHLARAERHLAEVGGLDHLFVRKWKAIGHALEHGNKRALSDLEDVLKEAQAVGHSETVRDCDLYLGLVAGDQERLARVFFGTPYESFRKRVLLEAGEKFQKPVFWDWGEGRVLDVALGTWADGKRAVKPGQLLHRLLAGLSSDAYKSFRAATLFGMLYPDEFYNPFSSPDRIYEAVRRLRAWAKQQRTKLEIAEKNGEYRLKPGHGLTLRIAETAITPDTASIAALRGAFGRREFSTREAALALGVSERSASRIIREALSERHLLSSGKSQFVRYRLP